MEISKTKVSQSELSSTLNLSNELKDIPKEARRELLNNIGELLIEQVLISTADKKSPVAGLGGFVKLSKDYADFKDDEVGNHEANLDLTGDMLNSLEFKISGDSITIGVFGDEAPKADGHNNFSGKSRLPTRRFLPDEGQMFKRDIVSLIKDEIEQVKSEQTPKETDSLTASLFKMLGI